LISLDDYRALMNGNHANIRDEQFWFTTATVGFNTVLFQHAISTSHKCLVLSASALISLFGAYLVLTRWLHDAGRAPAGAPENWSVATARQRLQYTRREFVAAFRSLPFVLFEVSGALFYLSLIAVTFAGVAYRCLR
jgi:hypothetical protein